MTNREQQIVSWIRENPQISQQELADRAGITRSSVAVHISNLMKKGVILGKGYVLQENRYVVVVGGVNIDICGKPYQKPVLRDSNPGTVRTSMGGVGRNIAHNLRLMDVDVKMITALGDDMNARKVIESCDQLGIDISAALSVPDATTSSYVFLTNEKGDMELAVSDMEIYNHLTPEFIATRMSIINHAALCIVDTNIPQDTIEYLAANCEVPLFVDPVSTTKMHKLQNVLDKIHTFKPNCLEAELLTGITCKTDADLKAMGDKLLSYGIKKVFISLGSNGVYCQDAHKSVKLPCYPTRLANTTGAGDTFTAAIAWGFLNDFSMEDTAKAGLAAASICVESNETINQNLNCDAIIKKSGITVY